MNSYKDRLHRQYHDGDYSAQTMRDYIAELESLNQKYEEVFDLLGKALIKGVHPEIIGSAMVLLNNSEEQAAIKLLTITLA